MFIDPIVRLIIFDFDGVLINGVVNKFPASLLDEFLDSKAEIGKPLSFKTTNWIEELAQKGINVSDREILTAISRRINEHSKGDLKLFNWVRNEIPKLAETHKLAILTNNSLVTVLGCLKGLEKYFSVIKTWENVSQLKPSPQGLLSICQELNILPTMTLMVGDTEEDSITADLAGAQSITVVSGELPLFL
jgi:HAD superfamily hydrolase (TIGR01509 family)